MTPLEPCPVAHPKMHGAHQLNAIIPETSDGTAVLFCDRCGIFRYIPITPVPMDDYSAADIRAMAKRD